VGVQVQELLAVAAVEEHQRRWRAPTVVVYFPAGGRRGELEELGVGRVWGRRGRGDGGAEGLWWRAGEQGAAARLAPLYIMLRTAGCSA
jgi:hypothetical protein